MKLFFSSLLMLSFLAACAPVTPGPEPAIVPHTYTPTDAPILNPERGFFTPYVLPGPVGFSPLRVTGNTLAHLNIRLDKWRDTDLPQDVLDGLDQNFADIRAAEVKAILRVAYNQGPFPDSDPDASKAQILRHIEQLKPLFQKNGDVIAWVEAGFIGAWGEWHTSTHGLDNLTDKRDILNALLAALPANRMAQVRYPANIIEMYPDPMEAVKARVAHHNDCFLSSATDVGTYERDGVNTIVRDQAYLAELTRYTPMSGETCAPNPPRSDCNSAIREMELLHFSAINEAYHKGILRSWEKGGCMAEIENRLGYRLTLTSAGFNEQVRPGGLLNLTVTLKNTGFAALMNPRPLFVILIGQDGLSIYKAQLSLDPRQWQPGESSFTVKLRLPANIGEGPYNLSLWLPDEAVTLQSDPQYAVRFANENVWDEKNGYNVLGTVNVVQSATGSVEKTDILSVVDLKASEVTPLPTTTPALSAEAEVPSEQSATATLVPTTLPQPTGPISGLQVSNDAKSLSFQFAFTGAPENYNGFQIFLDTDQNSATGLAISGLGADFLLENGILNAYAGKGNDWNWKPLETKITYLNANQIAQWSLRRADIGDPSAFDFAAQLVDTGWNTVFITQKALYTLQ